MSAIERHIPEATHGREWKCILKAPAAATAALLPLSGRGAEVRIRLVAAAEFFWASGSNRPKAVI